MKYEIDTIPVWDALRAGTECPLCLLEKRSRQAAVRYFLGPSVMVPEVRLAVNATGFRPENLRLLSKDPNKLGLALLSHTRLKTLRSHLNQQTGRLRGEAAKASGRNFVENLPAKKNLLQQLRSTIDFLNAQEQQCLIEDKVTDDRKRYAFTLLHLWQKDSEFRAAWAAGQGTCLHHAVDVLDMAGQSLGAAPLGTFVQEFLDVLERNLGRIEDDVLAFTQTFDSTHSHVPHGNPDGALDRCLQKLAGTFPEYEEPSKSRRGPLMGPVSST